MFSQKATQLNESVTHRQQTTQPSITSHGLMHNELRQYSELTGWLKESENQRFIEVCEVSLTCPPTHT